MIENTAPVQDALIQMDQGTQRLLTLSLAFSMFAVSLGLKPRDFEFVKHHPQSILIGVSAQLILLPLLTLALVYLIAPEAGIAMGMLIAATCPGGTVSNLLTRISKGDVAYSVSLTMVSSIFSTIALPFAILFWTNLYTPTANLLDEININRVSFILNTSVTLVIPLLIGITLAHFQEKIAERLNKICIPIAIGILMFLIISGLITNWHLIRDHGTTIMPIVIVHNALSFFLGFVVAALFLKTKARTRSLTFEVGIQNTGLGLLVVLTQLGGLGSAAIIVGTWSIWHIFAGFFLALAFRWLDRQTKPTNS